MQNLFAVQPSRNVTTFFAHSVLLIEDQPLAASLIAMLLEAAGLDVQTATTLEEARARLQQSSPDVILASWEVDGIDGRGILRELKLSNPEWGKIPSILMTNHEISALTRCNLAQEGIACILQKPIVPTGLARLLDRTVGETQVHSLRMGSRSTLHYPAALIAFGATASSMVLQAV